MRTNVFYHGDCLTIMAHDIDPLSIDLIYLDPPFFTGKVQKGTLKANSLGSWQPEAMEISFEDSRKFWSNKGYADYAPGWLKAIGEQRPDFASYLYYMMVRLQACHKVLKRTGSLYLHCDEKASHYLKMILDKKEMFGWENFRNEIIWRRMTGAKGNVVRRFGCSHDTILFYAKSKDSVFSPQYNPLDEKYVKTFYRYKDENGRLFRKAGGGRPSHYRYYLEDSKGVPVQDAWMDIVNVQSGGEDTGYPTQKPVKLLERIINASSKENDIVFDPFGGCGTTAVVAHNLGRRWIAVDISRQAIDATLSRCSQLPADKAESFISAPVITRDLDAVKCLDAREFEKWVNEYYQAHKPSPDLGVDGITPDGIPIQTKTNLVKYEVIQRMATAARQHPAVPKPVKRAVIVSQVGFDDTARRAAFGISQPDGMGLKLELIMPEEMLAIKGEQK